MKGYYRDSSSEDLKAELDRLRADLSDIEDMHSYATGKTSVHIGGSTARVMQEEFEEECRVLAEKIGAIESELRARGSG